MNLWGLGFRVLGLGFRVGRPVIGSQSLRFKGQMLNLKPASFIIKCKGRSKTKSKCNRKSKSKDSSSDNGDNDDRFRVVAGRVTVY